MPYVDIEKRRECRRKCAANFRAKNPEKAKAWVAAWRAKHPDINAYASQKMRDAYAKDPLGKQAKKRSERALRKFRDPDRLSFLDSQRLDRRRRNLVGSVTPEEWKHILTIYGRCCLRCGKPGRMTRDHVIPISLGGPNIAANLQPLCSRCNAVKATKSTDYRPFPYFEAA